MKDVYVAERKPSPLPLVLTSLLTGCIMYAVGQWRAETQFLEQAASLRQHIDRAQADVKKAIRSGCYDFVQRKGEM